MTEAGTVQPSGDPSQKRGRPRPQDTMDRDEKIYQLLAQSGPLSKEEVATRLGFANNLVYMSLYRLQRDNYVRRVTAANGTKRSNTWEAIKPT